MPRPILVASNAELRTASVSVRTLTIEGKQVTLAVFRQLIEEDIYDHEKEALNGVGWGHVNYLLKDRPFDSPPGTINLVWQRGLELRRCFLRPELPPLTMPARPIKENGLFYAGGGHNSPTTLCATTIWWQGRNHAPQPDLTLDLKAEWAKLDDLKPQQPPWVDLDQRDEEYNRNYQEYNRDYSAWDARRVQRMKSLIEDFTHQAQRALDDLRADIEARRARYASTVTPLFDLPQLFIAV